MNSQDIQTLKTTFDALLNSGQDVSQILMSNWEFLYGIDATALIEDWDELRIEEKTELWDLFDEAIDFAQQEEAEELGYESAYQQHSVWNKAQTGVR